MRHAQRLAVQKGAAAPLRGEQFLAGRIVDRRNLGHAVDLERERRAEDRQAVREVRGPVDRIEHPARARPARSAAPPISSREHLVIGKSLGDHRAEHPLDGEVDLGHEIDGPLLVDLEVAAELRHLQIAGAGDRLDGGGEKQRIDAATQAGSEPSAACTRLTMRISIPPSGARRSWTSSMKLRIRKMPRPLDLRRFSGSSGFGDRLRVEALALVADADRQLGDIRVGRGLELDEHVLGGVAAVAVLDRVDHRFADGHAHPMQRILVEADAAREVIADHLHEVEHLERAGELEPDELMTVCRHVCATRHSINTISSVMSRRAANRQREAGARRLCRGARRSRKILTVCRCPPLPSRPPADCAAA